MIRKTVPLLIALLAGCAEPPPRPSLVLMVADALGAGELGCTGDSAARTPHLDALARRGLQFPTCLSQSPDPAPSLATLLTGRYPSGHGAITSIHEIAPGVPMMAEGIRSRSYRTAAFLEGALPREPIGRENGFDVFRTDREDDAGASPAAIDSALAWVRSDWRPCLLAVSRSGAPDEVDRGVGALLRGLEEHGTASHAFFVFTALRAPGAEPPPPPLHGRRIDVPMIVTAPHGISPALREDPAALIDVLPTALQCLGFAPTRVPGRGLLRRPAGEEGSPGDRTLYAEAYGDHRAKAVRAGDWKAVHDELADTWTLYDLAADPAETRDVAAEHPDRLRRLQEAMPEPGMFDAASRSDG